MGLGATTLSKEEFREGQPATLSLVSVRPPSAVERLMAKYTAARDRIARLGGKLGSEAATATIWDEVETIADRMGEDASATINDVSLKLRVALDLVDEQDPARKLILSATNDLTILAAAQRPDFRLA